MTSGNRLIIGLIAALCQKASASLGVLNVQDLLQQPPGLQQHLSAETFDYEGTAKDGLWTHSPVCAHPTSSHSASETFCVFTQQSAFNNGISILSTAKVADAATPHLSENPLGYFFDEAQIEEWFARPRPWEVVEIRGKDKGVVATRNIKKYQTFMVDQASIVMDLDMQKSVSEAESLRLLRLGIDRLRDPERVRSLSKRHSSPERATPADDEEIMMTNSFGTEIGPTGTNVRAIFPIASRMNHACHPNAFVMFSQSGFSMGVKAYRDIAPGEEITISYLNLGMPYKKRQAELMRRYHFTCTCDLCTQPAAVREASDAGRERIDVLGQQLRELWKELRYQAAVRAGEEIVDLMREEGLVSSLPDTFVILARLHLLLGERQVAEEWADEALEVLDSLGFLGIEGRDGGDGDGWGLERLLGAFEGT